MLKQLKTIIYEEQINLLDEEFIYRVFNDIEQFLKENTGRCVLIFPPLNNRRRYYIHRVGQIFNVQTFSVGEGSRRFTVVCSFEKDITQVDETDKEVMDSVRAKKGAISKSKRAPRPDAPIYVPPGRRGHKSQPEQKTKTQDPPDTTENTLDKMDKKDKKQPDPVVLEKAIDVKIPVPSEPEKIEPTTLTVPITTTTTTKQDPISEKTAPTDKLVISGEGTNVPTETSDTQNKCAINNNNIAIEVIKESYPTIKNVEQTQTKTKLTIYDNKDNDQEQEEMVRASEEFNRRNKKIIKQSFNKSDVLIISDLKKTENVQEKLIEKDATPAADSWEDLLDNGQLDSDLMLEIKLQVGNVKISNAKEDYREYSNKSILNGDFSHVVEIYDFPKEFQTRDLVTIIDSFTNGTYHIKWVDDNHALGVFSSGFVVNELLKIKHPLLKLRSMGEASKQSVEKAMRYPNAMMPSAVRAQTCPQTARRMITGALGLKLNNAKEERAQEIKILKEARAKKRLSAKQQDDAWEGNTSSS